MDTEKFTEPKFSFPADNGKEPLVSFGVNCNEKTRKILAEALIYRKSGSKIGAVLGEILFLFIMINIVAAAITAKAYSAAVMYTLLCIGALAVFILPVMNAKKAANTPPCDCEYYFYSFYRHHFTLAGEYEGLSLSYDDISAASEDVLAFTLYMCSGRVYVIPKNELDTGKISMLHAVLENKLGSKLDVKFL